MRLLWTLFKVVVGLVLIVPLCIIALATGLGILSALFGLAVLALRLALIGVVGYGAFRLIAALMRKRPATPAPALKAIPPVDPYYEAALRDLDKELA